MDDWEVVRVNAGLVHGIARRLQHQAPWIDLDDLVQEGLLLLHQAVGRHDARVARLSTYGSKVVWWGLLKYIKRRRDEDGRHAPEEAAEGVPQDSPTPEEALCQEAAGPELSVRIAAISSCLDDVTWAVVIRRSGYHDGRAWTYRQIGEELGIPRAQAAAAYRAAVARVAGGGA